MKIGKETLWIFSKRPTAGKNFKSYDFGASAGVGTTSPVIRNTTGCSAPATLTVMVLLKGPGLEALNPALILSSFPFGTAPSGFTGVVQPQEAMADSITIGPLLILVKVKS